ncbi:MAG: leucine-rich repeat domain-containing protein [Spirochaetaceae bacterium]|nr:leucine-rich repeat domain-containing protein [Spirochaetaceae bacterium]
MEEKDRHFLFGIVASVGLCFIILVFFTGDEALKDNPAFLNFFFFLLFIFLVLLIFYFVLEIIFVSPSTKWHIVTECSQDQELRSKRNLLFHQDITVFPSSIISYCEAVERVEFAGSDCYFIPGSFEGCANLEYIKLPHRLERIPDNMFKNCSSLKEIIIPSTVKSIGKNAFSGCKRLTSVTFEDINGWYVTQSYTGAAKEADDKIVELNSKKPTENAELVKEYADRYWYKQK